MRATAATAASAVVLCWIPKASAFTQPPLSVTTHHLYRGAGRTTDRSQLRMSTVSMPTVKTNIDDALSPSIDMAGVQLSGLKGVALKEKTFPTKSDVMNTIPQHCFVKDTVRSMMYAAFSTAATLIIGGLAAVFLPLKWVMMPAWIAYAIVCGTVATGAWVVAHECGHGAFSDNKALQNTVGYVLHSALLVPYFSWQRSHAIHHANTNHMSLGETHVPEFRSQSGLGLATQQKTCHKIFGRRLGKTVFGALQTFNHLVIGWPAYLLFGATGGPSRGMTSHFFPHPPFSTGERKTELYPGQWKKKVWISNIGVACTLAGLASWAAKAGVAQVAALYGGPYLVVNAWLVLITWLQHTEVDVPHFDAENWNFVKGAFHTVDRPYGRVLDFLHHRIGSTHVAHHIDSTIPHYHALEATEAIKRAFPEHYLYEPTPVPQAMWRLATNCVGVEKRGNMHVFVGRD